MHCFSSLWVLGLVRQARGWVTLLCPCLPPPREPGGTGRSRVVREDLPPPLHQHGGEGRELHLGLC